MPQLVFELSVIIVNICRLLAVELEMEIRVFFDSKALLKFTGFLFLSIFVGILLGYSNGLDDGYRHALVSAYILSK